MRRVWVGLLLVSAVVYAADTINQGAPGKQGPWPVTLSGSSSTDGGSINVLNSPCANIVMTNDAGYGTTPSRVPSGGGAVDRIWIRICNDITNSSGTICRCSTGQFCPAVTTAGAVGDAIATGDCVTYPIGRGDAGTPCCVCNGAASFLPSAECIP